MPAPTNTLLIEGTFEELADELAQYIDNLRKSQGDEGSAIKSEIEPLLKEDQKDQKDQKDEVLKKLVTGAAVLNSAPEKEFVAAYNLLIHLVRQSKNINMFLARICTSLTQPVTSSPANGSGLALSILSTIFNIVPPDNEARYHVLLSTIRVVRASSNFETLKPQLKHLDSWLAQWDLDDEAERKLYLALADLAHDSAEPDQSYQYLVRALRTIPADEASSPAARELALRALKAALAHPAHFDFQDVAALDAVQVLRKSDPVPFELLEIFTAEAVDEFNDFKDEHDGWVEREGLDDAALSRKMRLLTLASLAAGAGQSRALPYAQIARALQVPKEEVEMWVIDVIRAGLVEGKLSQSNQTFLIHRSTYRVFGENQWREVAARLDIWRNSLQGVLGVIRAEKERFAQEKEMEVREMEGKANGTVGANVGSGYRRPAREMEE